MRPHATCALVAAVLAPAAVNAAAAAAAHTPQDARALTYGSYTSEPTAAPTTLPPTTAQPTTLPGTSSCVHYWVSPVGAIDMTDSYEPTFCHAVCASIGGGSHPVDGGAADPQGALCAAGNGRTGHVSAGTAEPDGCTIIGATLWLRDVTEDHIIMCACTDCVGEGCGAGGWPPPRFEYPLCGGTTPHLAQCQDRSTLEFIAPLCSPVEGGGFGAVSSTVNEDTGELTVSCVPFEAEVPPTPPYTVVPTSDDYGLHWDAPFTVWCPGCYTSSTSSAPSTSTILPGNERC